MKWVCKKCQSTDIEVRVWYKPNTNQLVVKDLSTINDDDVWCHACDGGGFGMKKKEDNE